MTVECMGTIEAVPKATDWDKLTNAYECRVLLCPEENGYSAFALRLPGVTSQGDTKQEALENIADAFAGAIQSYRENGGSIPWSENPVDRIAGCEERWILVNV